MNKRFTPSFVISTSALLLLNASSASACQSGPGSPTITNLQDGADVVYQIFGMNQAGQLTGFFFDFPNGIPPQAILYSTGTRTDLGTLGGTTSEGHSINASGQIVGQSDLLGDAQSHAFLYTGGMMSDLGTLGGPSSTATAINDSGVIIGDSDSAEGGTGAFIITNGVMTSIGNLGSNYSSAFAINSSGVVVGQAGVASGGINAFVYSNGVLSNLGTLGADYSAAFAINDAGEIVGESAVNNTETNGFVYLNGTMTQLGTFGGAFSTAYLVNSVGQAVGVASFPAINDVEDIHGFLYSNGTMTDLGTLGGNFSLPNAINSKGQIVGDSVDALGTNRAFIWENGTLTDLNTLLPANSGWELMQAFFINDSGRIAGVGTFGGMSQWFIMDLTGASSTNNNPPIAVAGPDQTVDCAAQANLDGSGSHDPDNDPLTYEWSANGTVLGTTAKLSPSFPIGKTVVTLKVTDPCGASSTATLTVTVTDTTRPTGSCPGPVTVSADSNCQAALPNLVPLVSASDNCTPVGSLVITQDLGPGTLVGLGPHIVTITVTDTSGNASQCQVLFTVNDTTPPVITHMPDPFTVSVGANCLAQMPNVLSSVTATDSCTPADGLMKSQNPSAGTSLGVGEYPLTVTVTDAAGNVATQAINFKVVDNTAPTILGPSTRNVSAGADCQGTVPNMFDGFLMISDNCTPASQLVVTQNPAPGTVLSTGFYPVTVTVTDASGNTATTSVLLGIVDSIAPVIQTLSVTPNAISPPNHRLVPVTVSVVVNDSCDSAPVTKIVSITTNDGASPGDIQITGNLTALLAANKALSGGDRVYTITVKSTDASNNSSTAQVTVTVPKSNGSSTGG